MNARKGRGGPIGLVRNTVRDTHHACLGDSNELRHGPRGGEVIATLRACPGRGAPSRFFARAKLRLPNSDLLTPRPTLAQSGPRMGASKEVESLAARLEDFPGFDEMRVGSVAGSGATGASAAATPSGPRKRATVSAASSAVANGPSCLLRPCFFSCAMNGLLAFLRLEVYTCLKP